MNPNELRASLSLAAVFSVRLLGLFMIYPVFATYAERLSGATEFKIGLALGGYGLTQGLLQIPFGLLSDRIGRKTMIVAGLALFAAGSAVAALSGSIEGVIAGRVLQGCGAVGSVILALVADLTREEVRTRAMAIVGITIGLSFMLAIVAGPILAGAVGVAGIFWLMVPLAAVGVAIVQWGVPTPTRARIHRDAEPVPALLGAVFRDPELLRLDAGVFALHAILTASFLAVPHLLADAFGLASAEQWMVYLPILVVSVALMVPAIIVAEKRRRMKEVFLAAIALLAVSQAALFLAGADRWTVVAAIVLFFAAFNVMEASLPSLITKAAPAGAKGTATGVYSSAQFLGIFVGGAVGGAVHQAGGTPAVFAFAGALALAWLAVAATMRKPGQYRSYVARTGAVGPGDADRLAARLAALPGVADAVVVADERTAYLKVESQNFDSAEIDRVAGGG
jgi:predicted MFS family arabinose efflux permease